MSPRLRARRHRDRRRPDPLGGVRAEAVGCRALTPREAREVAQAIRAGMVTTARAAPDFAELLEAQAEGTP